MILTPLLQRSDSLVEQVAFDEAMIDCASVTNSFNETFRCWQLNQGGVVLGRSSPVAAEVDTSFCDANDIQIVRRCSGGQTIVTAPGCLMYAVLLDYRLRPDLKMLDRAHGFVMARMESAIASLGIQVQMQGTSDLTYQGQKFSGNSLRCKKDWFVYHGTVICQDFDLSLIPKCLKKPIREPDYRAGRSHEQFLTRLPIDCETLETALTKQWNATDDMPTTQQDQLLAAAHELAKSKYSTDQWTHKVP